MRKFLTISTIIIGLSGCCSYKNVPYVVYRDNEIEESINSMDDYCIYKYTSTVKGIMDNEDRIPAHYQILIPPKSDIKKIYCSDINRCFVFTKSRGIAIFQDIQNWERVYTGGFRQVSKDSVENYMSEFGNLKKIKVMERRSHYLYVDHEIRIVFFNLSKEDYKSYVESPLKSLIIMRRGEIQVRKKYTK